MSNPTHRLGRLAFGLLLSALFPLGLQAQGGEGNGGVGLPAGWSEATRALEGGIGLLLGAGGPVPSSPSTAGRRVASSPRWVFDAGVAFAGFSHPDPLRGSGEEIPETRRLLMAPRVTLVSGLYEGWSPMPGVGGVGSLDLLSEVRLLPLPDLGGGGGAALALGAGARVGILRESFSLPGITLVGVYRSGGPLRYGEIGEDALGEAELRFRPRSASIRGVVGKDLLEVGVSAGVQRDRISRNGRVLVGPNRLRPEDPGATGDLYRTTWFVGANRTWVVSQVAFELGWSPESEVGGALTGALSFRITY